MEAIADENCDLSALRVERKSGNEKFVATDAKLSVTLTDFWRLSVSDLVSNATRGILAEFIVANALKLDTGVRTEWDAYDLKLPDDTKIEIKSAAFCQSWTQTALSKIRFTIRPTYGWDSSTNLSSTELIRQANLYVFCLLHHQDKKTVNPLDLDQWIFYLVEATKLNKEFPTQKSIGLSGLLKLEPLELKYGELASGILDTARKIVKE
ncbi:MAG: hypothetical protein ACKVQJ_00995 [Pyrinomonadaceae bacterium]